MMRGTIEWWNQESAAIREITRIKAVSPVQVNIRVPSGSLKRSAMVLMRSMFAERSTVKACSGQSLTQLKQ